MAKRRKLGRTTTISNLPEPEPAKILELPNELLILILFDTEETDIISLALTCRRLNHIAFGYYLSPPSFSPLSYIRQSISLRDTLSVSYNRGELHMFEALRLSFFKKPIPRIIYTYFSSPSFTSEMRHASLFFQTGPSLEKVSLSFYSVCYTKSKPAAARRAMECLLKSLTCVRVYQKTFDLELSGTNIVVDDTAPSPSFNGILLRTPTKLTLKGTTFLFKHPFLYWTINSMDACRLSNLHLANVNIGPYLNLITLDTLRELTVVCHTVTQVELSAFLSRHDGIVTLLVHNIADIPNGDAALQTKADKAIAKGALPKVHRLQMPPKYLLSWLRARASLRSLKVLHLEYRVPDSQLQDILHALASRSETTPLHTLMLPLYSRTPHME